MAKIMRYFVFELLEGVKTKEIPITRDFISMLEVETKGDDREKGRMDEETLKDDVTLNLTLGNLYMNNAQGLMNTEASVEKPTINSQELCEEKFVLMKSENSIEKGKQIKNSLEEEEVWYHNVHRTMRVELPMNPPSVDSTKKSKKRASKRKFFESESSETKVVKPKKQRKNMPQTGPNPKPDLPTRFKNLIRGVGGSEPVLVIQKHLSHTDVSDQHGRLSIPMGQVEQGFELDDDEKREVDLRNIHGKNYGEISAWIMGPSTEKSQIKLRKWGTKKPGPGGENNPIFGHSNSVHNGGLFLLESEPKKKKDRVMEIAMMMVQALAED
ncbi:unnamed protein product [Ilex paraguariensis]|uniref:Uncharacterized protein n=1 Tax=Ilex paraguariensis TaxID=185542 RepID=A0ABC8SYQ9_9AQUA